MNNDLLAQLATQITDIKSQAIALANEMPSLTYAEFDTAINALIGEAWTAKQLYNDLKKQNPSVIYGIDEAKLHISFFTGYEHLHPYNDNQNMAILPIMTATSDTAEMGDSDDPFTGKGGNP